MLHITASHQRLAVCNFNELCCGGVEGRTRPPAPKNNELRLMRAFLIFGHPCTNSSEHGEHAVRWTAVPCCIDLIRAARRVVDSIRRG